MNLNLVGYFDESLVKYVAGSDSSILKDADSYKDPVVQGEVTKHLLRNAINTMESEGYSEIALFERHTPIFIKPQTLNLAQEIRLVTVEIADGRIFDIPQAIRLRLDIEGMLRDEEFKAHIPRYLDHFTRKILNAVQI